MKRSHNYKVWILLVGLKVFTRYLWDWNLVIMRYRYERYDIIKLLVIIATQPQIFFLWWMRFCTYLIFNVPSLYNWLFAAAVKIFALQSLKYTIVQLWLSSTTLNGWTPYCFEQVCVVGIVVSFDQTTQLHPQSPANLTGRGAKHKQVIG